MSAPLAPSSVQSLRFLRPLFVFAALAAAAALLGAAPPPRHIEGVALALEAAAHGVVKPENIRWEPASTPLNDATRGRWVLFLASDTASAPKDLWRARVTVSPEGAPLEVVEARNLTSTAVGDDTTLVVNGTHAAFATVAFGQVQSVTLLDLAGEGTQNQTEKWPDRLMAAITNVQNAGTWAGIARVDITLDQPAKRVGLALGSDALSIQLADDDSALVSRHAKLDFARGELEGDLGMHAQAERHLPKPIVFWAVDTVRAVPWIGAGPIAWLEEKVFSLKDSAKQAAFKMSGKGAELAGKVETLSGEAPKDNGAWPPPPIRSIWKTPDPKEGEWAPPTQAWIKKFPLLREGDAAPSAFFGTFVRPDDTRPYSRVLMVAMDMRQLDLDMEAGSEDPKPLVGPPGVGHIPRDTAIASRVSAAFNGGFKTEHGTYGMMVKKRVLLPAQPGAAAVVVLKDGRFGMGTWGTSHDVSGILGVSPNDIVSFRQNLDPLLDADKINPNGRALWGFTLPGTSMQTERSGMCVTPLGHLIYAWGEDLNAGTLGKAMKMAGCVYGMHLDMNPHHTGFVYSNVTEMRGRNWKSDLLSSQMGISPDRYIEYAPKDFFYVMMRDPFPPTIEGAPWKLDPGTQPSPSWFGGLFNTQLDGADVLEVEPARASFRIRAGTREPDAKTGVHPSFELATEDAKRVLFAVGMGASTERRPKGLGTEGRLLFEMSHAEKMGVLISDPDGRLKILRADEFATLPQRSDVAELPLILEGTTADESVRSGMALGVNPEGRTFVVRASRSHGAALASVLKKFGCTSAVLLDRGGAAAFLHRSGTGTPPRSRYEETVLYGMANALAPRGFRFEAEHPVPPPAKK